MHRRWSIVATILMLALATGCVKKDDDGGATPSTNTTAPTGGLTTPTPGGNGTQPPPKPSTQPVTDAGDIAGQFAKEWVVNVPAVSPKSLTVNFNLSGAQAGAPATARIILQFLDPAGAVLKSATAGVGGTEKVAWSFTAADLPATGDYKIKASSDATAPGPGLPSGGVAKYTLFAFVEY